ncbi:hypothetical protein [Tautonia rosea]|uniref:hypothetical protein n=1 Tax=Tautonia rosea TaxID=2728037 RepID=UPI0014751ACA|nr:hypothetical protein [Tautonia rosea]
MSAQVDRRKHLLEAIGKVGAESLPSRQLDDTFKHEGNRHWFSNLKHAEEEYLLHARLRRDAFGNVQGGGPDTIAEGLMASHEAVMREAIAEILFDADEAGRIVNAFVTLVRKVFGLPEPSANKSRARGFWNRWR